MILYKPSKHAIFPEGETLTEQEHKDSCDINLMLRHAGRGLQVRGGPQPEYGYDDTTMDAVRFRIEKDRLEKDLSSAAKSEEFSEEQISLIPEPVRKKFGFKAKKSAKEQVPPNDKQNDEKGTNSPEPPKSSTKPSE